MSIAILRGDARSLPLPDSCADLIVTSPPYWALRSYSDNGEHYDGQIGSEETPGEWLASLLECTREWVRVLKPSGSIFVNLGDKYANDAKWGGRSNAKQADSDQGSPGYRQRVVTGVAPKGLIGLPWRYALACMDDLGLTLRRDIVWHKVNPLPESVDDRCATRHEYLFHFVRQPRYYAAIDEIREPHTGGAHGSGTNAPSRRWHDSHANGHRATDTDPSEYNPLGKLPGSVWDIPSQPLVVPERVAHGRCCGGKARPGCKRGLDHFAAFPFELPRRCILGWSPSAICTACSEGRRPVASSRRETYFGAGQHRSGAAQIRDGAGVTGWKHDEKWRSVTSLLGYACACTPYTDHPGSGRESNRRDRAPGATRPQGDYARKQAGEYERVGPWREYHLDGWVPPPSRPALVVDPFRGTGTTALMADILGRDGISFDRSGDYCRLARWRTTDPGERARAMQVPRPPVVPDGQDALFTLGEAAS